jgi:hypothetical protein
MTTLNLNLKPLKLLLSGFYVAVLQSTRLYMTLVMPVAVFQIPRQAL